MNALTCSDSVLIPIQCEYFALEGLGKLLNTIKSVQKIHNNNLDIEDFIDRNMALGQELKSNFLEKVKHFGK